MTRPDIHLTDADMLHRESEKANPVYWTDESAEGMVATAHYRATRAGAEVLKNGGNAVDAAVACSLALGVCEPSESGLGGMAIMLVHLSSEKRTFVIEGSCRAPALATPESVAANASRYRGYGAVAVPGCPAVLGHALTKYGSRSVAEVAGPAIDIAENGYPISSFQNQMLRNHRHKLAKENARTLYLDSKKQPLGIGFSFRNPALAETLRRIARDGFQDFYRGSIADQIAADMEAQGGFIRKEDLESFPEPVENDPVWGKFGDWDVATSGPPGGGLALLQMLLLYDKMKSKDLRLDSAEDIVLLARVIQKARKDRKRYRWDIPMRSDGEKPEFLKTSYAKEALQEIMKEDPTERGETSHLTVMDKWGNVVALTLSIERLFGAKVLTPELGFLYNGYLKTFKLESKSHPHYLRPGALARSNSAPTILFRKKAPCAALGATGSERIVSSLLQVILRLRYQSGFEALHSPRLHCSPDGEVILEIERFSPAVPAALIANGFTLRPADSYSHIMGGVQLVQRDGDRFFGTSEPRRDSAAAGPEKATG